MEFVLLDHKPFNTIINFNNLVKVKAFGKNYEKRRNADDSLFSFSHNVFCHFKAKFYQLSHT